MSNLYTSVYVKLNQVISVPSPGVVFFPTSKNGLSNNNSNNSNTIIIIIIIIIMRERFILN